MVPVGSLVRIEIAVRVMLEKQMEKQVEGKTASMYRLNVEGFK